MQIDEELERKLIIAEVNENKEEKRFEKAQKLLSMPFHLRIQEEGMKQTLKKVEQAQRETFERVIKKRHSELILDWKDLFAEFFIDFLKGKVVSINDFLYEDRLAPIGRRKLKKQLII